MTITYILSAPAGQEDEIIDTLRLFKGPTEARPGCLSCTILQDVDDPSDVIYIEEWQSEKALETHICSEHYRQLLSIFEISAAAPEIKLSTTVDASGIELIAALRGG